MSRTHRHFGVFPSKRKFANSHCFFDRIHRIVQFPCSQVSDSYVVQGSPNSMMCFAESFQDGGQYVFKLFEGFCKLSALLQRHKKIEKGRDAR